MNILLPIETINRELDYKLILGAALVKEGHSIYIGQHNYLERIANKMKEGGVYIGKTAFKTLFPADQTTYRQLKERGFDILYLDEEGGFYLGDEVEWKSALDRRLHPSALDKNDSILTWGDFQLNHYQNELKKSSTQVGTIVSTGQPRFDINKPKWHSIFENDIKRIKDKYGDFILINTNLSMVNNNFGIEGTFSNKNAISIMDPGHYEKSKSLLGRYSHLSAILNNILELVFELSVKFPNKNIVIRPHPGEDDNFYKKIFANFSNIKVVHEGAVNPWIIASDYLIHDGCTTAVEAYFAQKKVILFKPVSNIKFDLPIPNLIGIKCGSAHEVIELIEDNKSKFDYKIFDKKALSILNNFKGEDSFDNIINIVSQYDKSFPESKLLSTLTLKRYALVFKIISFLKSLIRPFFPDKIVLYKGHRKKYYGFNKKDAEFKVKSIGKILQKNVGIKYIDSNLIVLKSK